MLLNTGARTDDDDDAKRSDHTQMTEYTLDDYDDDDDAKNEAVGDYHSSVCGVKSPNWSNYSSRHHSYIISIYSHFSAYDNDSNDGDHQTGDNSKAKCRAGSGVKISRDQLS